MVSWSRPSNYREITPVTEDGQKVENSTIFCKPETAEISWYQLIRNKIKQNHQDLRIHRSLGS